MNRIEEIKTLLQDIDHHLKNPLNKKDVKSYVSEEDFNYDGFQKAIKEYLNNSRILNGATDSLLEQIQINANIIRDALVDGKVSNNIRNVLSSAIFLQENVPTDFPENYIDNAIQIPKEEFSRRYDKLIGLLNPLSSMQTNLTLETKVEKSPFKLFRNSNNTIAVISGQEKSPLSFTKDKLIQIVFDNLIVDYHKSYYDVIIEKILDNSIFDFITETTNTFNTDFMPDAKIKKLEEDRLQTLGKISELEKRLDTSESSVSDLNLLLHEAKEAEQSFKNAKNAALEDMALKQSYNFWETQATTYSEKYTDYLKIVLGLSTLLLLTIFIILRFDLLSVDFVEPKSSNSELLPKIGESIKNLETNTTHQIAIKQQMVADPVLTTNSIETIKSTKGSLAENLRTLWKYAFMILFTTIIIWIIKIMMKITLSNYHLSVDANERVIMIKTYLALIKEGSSYDEKDKKVILDNIFRPTNFGIIKDETSLTIADIVSSFKK